MRQEVRNFARFYMTFNRLPWEGDREDLKRTLVLEYTGNRTDSLREMTRAEYNACCDSLERLAGTDTERRRKRSVCLKLMQRLGVDTTDWERINAFCQDPRIAGKPFARIDIEGLDALGVKLRAIGRNGGLKPGKGKNEKQPAAGLWLVRIDPDAPKC